MLREYEGNEDSDLGQHAKPKPKPNDAIQILIEPRNCRDQKINDSE